MFVERRLDCLLKAAFDPFLAYLWSIFGSVRTCLDIFWPFLLIFRLTRSISDQFSAHFYVHSRAKNSFGFRIFPKREKRKCLLRGV